MHYKKNPIVSLQGKPVLLFNGQQHTLLDALEYKNISVFSQCRNGYCGACKTKIISGDVHYTHVPLIQLNENECLPCCCIPKNDLNLQLSNTNIIDFPLHTMSLTTDSE